MVKSVGKPDAGQGAAGGAGGGALCTGQGPALGHFAELERQQCLFSTSGYRGPRSPDRADAAIWGLTELMLEEAPGEALFEYYEGLLAEKTADEAA